MKKIIIIEIVAIILIEILKRFFGEWYSQSIYPTISKVNSMVASLFPFSLSDIVMVILVISLLCLCVMVFINFKARIGQLIALLLFAYIWFYLGWGVNYFRDNIHTRTAVERVKLDSVGFDNFAISYIEELNRLYCDIDTTMLITCNNNEYQSNYKRYIINNYKEITDKYKITMPFINSNKKMLSSAFMGKVGVSGYFNPLFGEFHVREDLFAISKPFVFAHEASHKGGVTSEDEANLMGFLACQESNDNYVKFSGYYSLLGYILSSSFSMLGRERGGEIRDLIDREIIELYKKDVEYSRLIYSDTLGAIQHKLYDIYLKNNNISSGVKSYSEVVSLLITFYYKSE